MGTRSVAAQQRALSEDEFNKIESAATRLSFRGPVREHSYSEHFKRSSGSEPETTLDSIYESESETRNKSLVITTENGKAEKYETIRIDGDTYDRKEGESWKKNRIYNRFSVSGDAPSLKRQEFKFTYIGKVTIGDKSVDVYESKKLREYEGLPIYIVIDRYWIRNDGKLLRTETTNTESDGFVSFHMVSDFEYPTNLVIKVPTSNK